MHIKVKWKCESWDLFRNKSLFSSCCRSEGNVQSLCIHCLLTALIFQLLFNVSAADRCVKVWFWRKPSSDWTDGRVHSGDSPWTENEAATDLMIDELFIRLYVLFISGKLQSFSGVSFPQKYKLSCFRCKLVSVENRETETCQNPPRCRRVQIQTPKDTFTSKCSAKFNLMWMNACFIDCI